MVSLPTVIQAGLGIVFLVANDRLAKAFAERIEKEVLVKSSAPYAKRYKIFRILFIAAGIMLLIFAVSEYYRPIYL